MTHATLMNEDFPAHIEAVFPSHDAAISAAKALRQRLEFGEEQFSIVSAQELEDGLHRNRYAFRASGRREQKRQLVATLIAFALIGGGLALIHFIGDDTLPRAVTYTIMGGLILAAVVITVIGMVSWRPARVETRRKPQLGRSVLVINVHDLQEQYALREILLDMGASVEAPVSASVN